MLGRNGSSFFETLSHLNQYLVNKIQKVVACEVAEYVTDPGKMQMGFCKTSIATCWLHPRQ